MKTEARMAHIPNELKLRPQWVCWKREMRDGKQTKVPYIADTGECRASSTNPTSYHCPQNPEGQEELPARP